MILKEQLCPKCSAVLRSQSGMSYCPHCLMEQTFLDAFVDECPRLPAPLSPEDLQEDFPDYQIHSFLGAGGMGLVYRARQRTLNREVALKVVPDDTANPEFRERFEREARTLARLNHPDFVQIYDHGQVPGWFFIAMEFIEGPDLGIILKEQGHLSPVRAHHQIGRLLESLAVAHKQGIVHRDLKPANLLSNGEILKVADFGLAKLQEDDDFALSLTGEDAALGTPFYIAPEQREGSPDVDQRADLYSVGVILYQVLTGTLPTAGYEPASKLAAVPVTLDKVIAKALQPRPEERYQSASEMKEALDRSFFVFFALATLAAGGVILTQLDSGKSAPEENIVLLEAPEMLTLFAPKNSPRFFGNFTDSSEDWLAVGAPDQGFFEGEAERSGKVYLYGITDGALPELRQTLSCPEPHASDQFGNILTISSDGEKLAVYSSDIGSVGTYHFYSLSEGKQWVYQDTLVLNLKREVEEIMPRVHFCDDSVIVSSPGSMTELALQEYFRDESGSWVSGQGILPQTRLNKKAKPGFQIRYHQGQLFVTAFGYNKGLALRSGALLIFEKIEGEWEEVQLLEEPKTQAFSYFGFDFDFPEPDRLIVSSLMAKLGEKSAAGAVNEFQRNKVNGRWEPVGQILPEAEPHEQKLFGQQLFANENQLLVFSALGSIKEPTLSQVQSRAHLFQRDPEGLWVPRRIFDSEEKGDTWLGRASQIPSHFLIANPGRNEIYLLPK